MKRFLVLLYFIMGLSGIWSSIASAQTDNAQKYLREAQQYNEKRKGMSGKRNS